MSGIMIVVVSVRHLIWILNNIEYLIELFFKNLTCRMFALATLYICKSPASVALTIYVVVVAVLGTETNSSIVPVQLFQ